MKTYLLFETNKLVEHYITGALSAHYFMMSQYGVRLFDKRIALHRSFIPNNSPHLKTCSIYDLKYEE